MPASEPGTQTLGGVQRALGLSRAAVLRLIALGLVQPERGPRGAYRFGFRDILLLRMARELIDARVPMRRVLQSLARLRAGLPAASPLTGLRLSSSGGEVAVRDREGRWLADSGQRLIDFDAAPATPPGGAGVLVLARRERAAAPPPAFAAHAPRVPDAEIDALLRSAEHCELGDDPRGAEALYREAIALAPGRVEAFINLSALLCLRRRPKAALGVLDQAVALHARDALLHFNRGVALEDLRRPQEAIEAYEAALALDRELADAHHNLAALYNAQGALQKAIRHLNAYRRLGG